MLSRLAAVYDVLDLEPGQRVRTIYITVDPRRDTPEQLRDYLAYFSTVDVRGLTGSREEIDAVAERYGVLYKLQEPNEAGHYLVAHTTTLFLVDLEGPAALPVPSERHPGIHRGGHQTGLRVACNANVAGLVVDYGIDRGSWLWAVVRKA